MAKLSVNVNKVATVRNSRGGREPSVIEAVRTCIDAGAPGITVHPRADARHITTEDVLAIADELRPLKGRVEYNIEGDARPGLVDLVLAVKPDQCTLVPVKPGEITSEAGWPADTPRSELGGIIERMQSAGIRVSLFIDPEPAAVRWAKQIGGDRVELYTEPFARAFERGPAAAAASFAKYAEAAELAHELGVGVNAGHDLDLKNLTLFRTLPHLDEVSIGHALISRALFVGLGRTVREYLAALTLVLLALVSPSLDCRPFRIDRAVLKNSAGLTGWTAAGTKGPFSLRTLRERTTSAVGGGEPRLVDGVGPGMAPVTAEPEISRALVDWLRRSLLS